MKKLIYCALALAAGLFAASCQQENLEPVQGGNTVTFTVEIPEVATKAFNDGREVINDLVYAVYITKKETDKEAFADYANYQPVYQVNPTDVTSFIDGKTTVELELINDQNYVILFWAQSFGKGIYNTADLRNVSYAKDVTTDYAANQGDYAAFSGAAFIKKVKGASTEGVTLTRPFAQINIATADPKNYNVVVESTAVTVKGAGAGFNVANQEAISGGDSYQVVFAAEGMPTDETLKVNNNTYYSNVVNEEGKEDKHHYIAMNYVFAAGDVDVDYTINTDHGTVTGTVPSAPVATNYRTNIIGDLLTSNVKYEVTLDDTWGTPEELVTVWDGETLDEPEMEVDEVTNEPTYVVSKPSELAYLAALVNGTLPSTYATKSSTVTEYNIKLTGDINLNNEQWMPIGYMSNDFTGTFDGNGHTIYNLRYSSTEDDWYVGLFGGSKNATFKNLTIENVNINCAKGLHFAALVGDAAGETVIENVTIKGDIKIEGDVTNHEVGRIGAVVGGNSGEFTLKNVIVDANEGGYVKGNSSIGGVAGQLQGSVKFENVTSNIDVVGGRFFAGGLIGLTAANSEFNTCDASGNVELLAATSENNLYRLGGIVGSWDDNLDHELTLSSCSFTGTLSSQMGEVNAETFDCDGYVGRGYSALVGAVVKVNDTEYIYKGDGKYSVDGKVVVTNAADFLAAVEKLAEGETITLGGDVTFDEEARSHNSGDWYDGLYYVGDKSFTIDLNNHTIGQNGDVNDYLLNFKNDGAKANVITLKNGTIDAGTAAYCALATASSNAQKMTVNLENINLINNNSNGAVVKFRGGAELNVKAGTEITGTDSYVGIEAVGNNTVVNVYEGAEIYQNGTTSYLGAIIGASYNATLNIYGGKGQSAKCGIIVMSTGATINVSGGEWTANGNGTVAGGNQGVLVSQNNRNESGWACKSILNVTGGTFKGGYDCWGMGPGQELDDAQINIKGGNFNANPANYVVAGYEATENAGTYTVDKPKALKELEAALANGGNVTLANDVTLLESIKVENKVVLDLNGKTITAPLFSAFEVKAGGELTVKNGKVIAYESTVRAIGGKVIIESGEYTSTGTALDSPATYRYSLDCREGGELIIDGGTFKSNNGMINVGSTVTINGGKFENIVEKTMTRHFAYVSAPLTINDGEFYGKANSSAGGCFFCGAAAGGDIQIKGGKFTSLWTSGSVNRIFEYYYGGTINVTGGLFNTNGGIATFVTENTDEATKAAYPYVAK